MSAIPPIGSLWLHRDGEERCPYLAWTNSNGTPSLKYIGRIDELRYVQDVTMEQWLAWQADADRIDKEQP